MTESPAAADQAAREQATDPAHSVLLEAPAGSGKTSVLTERYLRLLAEVDDPQQILAITFTRKAAAEMRTRVESALRGEHDPAHPRAALLTRLAARARAQAERRGWRLEAEPETLRIQTIDAFNYWLACELPLSARVGGTLRVSETARPLYERAARRTLAGLESDPAAAGSIELLFERHDNQWLRLEGLIADLLEQRSHWLPCLLRETPGALTARVAAALEALVRHRLTALTAWLPPALRAAAAALPGSGPLGGEPAHLAAWQRLQQLTQTKDHWRSQLTAHLLGEAYAPAPARSALRAVIESLRTLPGLEQELAALAPLPAGLAPGDGAALQALALVLRHAAAELHTEFAAAGVVDYTYVSGAARAALTESGAPTELALRTGLNLRHILVDEFQDTSLPQYQLLQALTAAWEPGDGRTLFLVGDPMQSIYRFRDAEVALFLRARAEGIGRIALTPLRLVRNFRAVPPLVDFANGLFAQVFPAADDAASAAVSYRASEAARAAPAAAQVLTLRLFADPAAEAAAIAAHLTALRARAPHADCAVLVAAHAHAAPIVAALERQGLPVQGVDLEPLRERVVVRDLVQLLCALEDLADRHAWLSVLRAPWCGATLASLTALTEGLGAGTLVEALADPARLARCAETERQALERTREVFGGALARRGLDPPADHLEATWLQLGAADAYEPAELEDARAFFDALAERAAQGEWCGSADLPRLLSRLFSHAGGAGERPVQVMTIHRAKGLEFEHVVLPALGRNPGPERHGLLRWADVPGAEGHGELLLAPAPRADAPQGEGLDGFLASLQRVRTRHERERLLYVAVTRARESLWLSAAPRLTAKGNPRIEHRSLLASAWKHLAPRFERIAPEPTLPAAARTLRRLQRPWLPAPRPPPVPLAALPLPPPPSEALEFSWVRERQRHVGTVVHAHLARLAQGALPAAGADGVSRAALLAQLAREGLAEAERAGAAELILEALGRTLADARGRWILSDAHREAQAELALTGVVAGRLRRLVIDRTFIAADGTRWVIDFKTSRHEGADLEAFLDQEVERYRGQLGAYRALAARLGPEPVRAALYFPLLSAFREL
ncbi:MAG: UvrD-helicase domain-containing protein [Gammaproteobacteria bacterium]|nr:UvrD-helicase domain-containing protein [Gammaproteobacteria bacterium]